MLYQIIVLLSHKLFNSMHSRNAYCHGKSQRVHCLEHFLTILKLSQNLKKIFEKCVQDSKNTDFNLRLFQSIYFFGLEHKFARQVK